MATRDAIPGADRGRGSDKDDAAAALIRDADVAMYAVKQGGGGAVRRHDSRMRVTLERQLEVETQLASALASGRIVAHYQPIVDLRTVDADGLNAIRGYEALARWLDDDGAVRHPAEFLDAADQAGLVWHIDVAVMRCAPPSHR